MSPSVHRKLSVEGSVTFLYGTWNLYIFMRVSVTWVSLIPIGCLSSLHDSVKLQRLCTLSLSLWLYRPLDIGRFFSFLILYTASRTPWTGDHPIARPLPTHRTTQTQNKHAHTDFNASSGIRTHDPSVRAGEDGSCLRPPLWSARLCVRRS
jgi:hypothetical protein